MPNQYRVIRERKYLPTPSHWNTFSHSGEAVRRIHGFSFESLWFLYHKGMVTAVYSEKEWIKGERCVLSRLLSEPSYAKAVTEEYVRECEAARVKAKKLLDGGFEKYGIALLLRTYEEIRSDWVRCNTYELMWYLGAEPLFRYIVSAIPTASEDEIKILSAPIVSSCSAKEQQDVLGAALRVVRTPNHLALEKEALTLASNYYWVFAGYDGYEGSMEEHYRRVLSDLIEEPIAGLRDKLGDLKRQESNLKKRQAELRNRLQIKDTDGKLLSLLQTMATLADLRKKYTYSLQFVFHTLLMEIGVRLDISAELLSYATLDDLKEGNTNTLRHTIQRRKSEPLLFYLNNGAVALAQGEEAEAIFRPIRQEKEVSVSEQLKGKVGSPGSYTHLKGRVRLITDPKDIGSFRKGEVLVTMMTTPEFAPAIRKAVAVVTDEGGVTCHAAVLCREMGVPAIIGTRNATKLLENGSEIEICMADGSIKVLP